MLERAHGNRFFSALECYFPRGYVVVVFEVVQERGGGQEKGFYVPMLLLRQTQSFWICLVFLVAAGLLYRCS